MSAQTPPPPRRSARRASAGATATALGESRRALSPASPRAKAPSGLRGGRGRGSAAMHASPHPLSVHWWSRFGRHKTYGNGLPRPLLRGWLHFLVLLLGVAALAAGHERTAVALPPLLRRAAALNPTARSFLAATLVSYVGSVAFHLLPFHQLRAYQRVLCFDFCTIMLAFTGQIAALVGWRHAATALSFGLTMGVAAICVAGLTSGALMWQYGRQTRRSLVLGQIMLSCAVEGLCVADKRVATAIAALKFAAFQWFAAFGRYDAPRSSGLVLPGIWGDHDNFHVLASMTHLAQVAAAANQATECMAS